MKNIKTNITIEEIKKLPISELVIIYELLKNYIPDNCPHDEFSIYRDGGDAQLQGTETGDGRRHPGAKRDRQGGPTPGQGRQQLDQRTARRSVRLRPENLRTGAQGGSQETAPDTRAGSAADTPAEKYRCVAPALTIRGLPAPS